MATSDDTALCALCGDDTGVDLAWAAAFPGIVCTACEARAVNAAGEPPEHRLAEDDGDNPVYIDEKPCWRKYREGGYVTMYDRFDCTSLEAYIAKTRPEAEPEETDEALEDEDGTPDGVTATIAVLRNALASSAHERELLASLETGLARLRVLYKEDRRQFDDGDLAYLRGVGRIVEALATFVVALDAPTPSLERLRDAMPILEPFAVGRRVAEELRALGTTVPARAPRDAEPRVEAPSCPDGHRMVVRRDLRGRYWECSRYPDCEATIPIE